MNKDLIKKFGILLLALIGFFTTLKLASIYYDANFNPYALSSFCSINDFIDCDGVAKTTYSVFLGIPLAFWGMFLYSFIILLLFSPKLKEFRLFRFLEVFKNPLSYIFVLGIISFTISMILACVSIFEIKKVCVLCFFTYFLDFLIAIFAFDFKKNIFEPFKVSVQDLISGLSEKKYLISFIVVAILGLGFLTYTSVSYVFAPQVKRYKSIKKFADMKDNPFKIEGNILGDENAKIIVHAYTDFLCPVCYAENLMLFRIATELNGVQIIYHNFPLDLDCNEYLTKPFHQGSCMMAKYSIAAKKQGAYYDMVAELFENKPIGEENILNMASKMGLNLKKLKEDANSLDTENLLKKDIDEAVSLKLDGTPALVINGKVYAGVTPYYEMKEILINLGANERK
jgi:protein-disulfide isomerase/uncharacterized membrane protein